MVAFSDTLIQSNMEPAFVTAIPADCAAGHGGTLYERGPWRMTVGFEGFEEQVDWQVDRCTALLIDEGLNQQVIQDYPVRKGILAGQYEPLNRFPFLLRAGLPLDRVKDFVKEVTEALKVEEVFVDFGCGRVMAAASDVPDGPWERLSSLTQTLGGHLMLEKAPTEFKKRHDVFGPVQPGWNIMHRIKEALDPRNIFAPGRLPGRK
jgi:FAD/FMN-containing dehydrogenase